MSLLELNELRNRLALHERNATKSSWLIRQLGRKIRHFPRDLMRRVRRSARKRWRNDGPKWLPDFIMDSSSSVSLPFFIHREFDESATIARICADKGVVEMKEFLFSREMHDLVDKAARLEPDIGALSGHELSYCPPWNDLDYFRLRQLLALLPSGPFDSVVLMPAGRMGGADLVAAVLARTLAGGERVLILRTDDTDWDRPDWYPDEVKSVDISTSLGTMINPQRALYVVLCKIGASRIFNVNSRRAFETFLGYGERLATQFRLYAYYFCADRTPQGVEVGYPIWFFANIFPYLTGALMDTRYLAQTMIERFAIPQSHLSKVRTIYTPAQLAITTPTMAERQIKRPFAQRPCILWAGRLDRQKRFDLLVDVARAMPDVDFRCWGKAVLDPPPEVRYLPANVELFPPFDTYDDLPLTTCDGWLYTSLWDGLPTILIELGALGVPIAASAVGGVPELIDEATGWPFDDRAGVEGAVQALRDLLADPSERLVRAAALQERVRNRHSLANYSQELHSI